MITSKIISKKLTSVCVTVPVIIIIVLFFTGCFVSRTDLYQQNFYADIAVRQGSSYISNGDGKFDFGYGILYNKISTVFTIENSGSESLDILSIACVDGSTSGFYIETTSLSSVVQAGDSTTFTITYSPTVLGRHSASIMIVSNGIDVLFTFTVEGHGKISLIEPDISIKQDISPIPDGSGYHDFGALGVGSSSSPAAFTIENGGQAGMSISSIYFSSGDTDQFSIVAPGIPGSIAPGSTTTITIMFSPTTSGDKSATVHVISDDPDENPYNFTVQGYGSAIPEPDIHVRQGATNLYDGSGLLVFVGVQEGFSGTPVTFTIENNGTLDLTANSAYLSSGDVSDFYLEDSYLPIVLGPASSVSFTITFSPGTAGLKSATVTIDNDDPDENPYTFTIEGFGQPTPVAEINVKKGGIDVPDTTFGHDFGNVEVFSFSSPEIFTVENPGTGDLTFYDIYSDYIEFTVNAPAVPFVLSPGGQKDFTVTFEPQTPAGMKSGNIFIDNDDADENPYTFSISGYADPVPIPDIHLKQGSTDIPNVSGSFYFGNVLLGSASAPIPFTIENNGTVDLNIVNATSSDPTQFIIADLTVFTIPQGGSTTFTITYSPVSVGNYIAIITLDNDDPDENPYTFTVSGDGDASGMPDINLMQQATVLPDGPGVYDFQNVLIGNIITKDFNIFNEGSADLTVSSVYFSAGDTDQFSIDLSSLSSIVSPVIPINYTTFDITFYPTETGSKSVELTIMNSDLDEDPYTVAITGYGDPAPIEDINVKRNTTSYPDGSTYNFGQVENKSTRTFVIENLGTDDLQITNILLLEGHLDFTLDLSGTAFTLTPGGSTTFKVTFDPQGGGTRWRNLVINNSDPNESPYNIRFEGSLD
jgi:hypothetical protein